MTEQYAKMLIHDYFIQNGKNFLLNCGNQNIYVILFENTFEMIVSQKGKLNVTQIVNYNNDTKLFLNTYLNIIENI